KALHIIFVVTWFAGLFYIVRLFVYHAEASALAEPERSILLKQYKLMQRRLWLGITWPSAVMTFILGTGLAHQYWPITAYPWLMAKLGMVFLLAGYHGYCHRIFKRQQRNICTKSGQWLRGWNEGATLFLFGIVFLVVFKDIASLAYGVLGLAILGGAL